MIFMLRRKLKRVKNKLRRVAPVLKRIKQERNCFIQMKDVNHKYFVDSSHTSNAPYYMSKKRAYKLHQQLKQKYYWKFIVKIKIKNRTRILIKE